MIIYGKNVVLETISKRPDLVKKVFVRSDAQKDYVTAVKPFKPEIIEKDRFDVLIKDRKHQGIAADIHEIKLHQLSYLSEKRHDNAVYILLDGLQDPHNLGSIIRTAYGMGIDGIILAHDRTCPVTPGVFTASAGYASVVPIIGIKNPANTLKEMKKMGYWIAVVDMNGTVTLGEKKDAVPKPVICVLGGEGAGVREIYTKHADLTLTIPQIPDFESYNVSVAAAITMWELRSSR